MINKLLFVIIVFISLIFVIILLKTGQTTSKKTAFKTITLNWQRIPNKPQFTLTESDIFRDNITFQWQGKIYKGSNTTPKQQNFIAKGEYFRLYENDKKILSLNDDENEMRYFQFTDCGRYLCIWGLNIKDTSEQNPFTPPIDLHLVMMPEKKQYSFTNPCKLTNQIDLFTINKINPEKFLVQIQCETNSTDSHDYFETTIDINNL